MAKIVFHPDQLAFTGGVAEIEIEARDYRDCVEKIQTLYPGLVQDELSRYMVTIDNVIIQSPFLEKLGPGSEMVFIRKITSG